MKRIWLISGGLLAFDQVTKFWAEHQSVSTLVHNYGAAYGIFQFQRTMLIMVGVLTVLGVMAYLLREKRVGLFQLGLAILLAGAVGNLVDRIFWGYVIDFIDIRIFPVFNVADMCIDGGIGLILLDMFRGSAV